MWWASLPLQQLRKESWHILYMCLRFPSLRETLSKTCLFQIGQYCLALLNLLQEESCEHLFKGLLV